jgi:hypothetical protein
MKDLVVKNRSSKRSWQRPEINVLPFKNTNSGRFMDTFEDATYATS